jgi:hypothetical protein
MGVSGGSWLQHQSPLSSPSEELKLKVWEKGKTDLGYNGHFYRRDVFGTWMQYSAFGDTLSYFGWEIGFIKPLEQGGTNDLSNLQPLQWHNNRRHGNS